MKKVQKLVAAEISVFLVSGFVTVLLTVMMDQMKHIGEIAKVSHDIYIIIK